MKKLFVLFVVLFGVSSLYASAPKNDSNAAIDWSKAEENYKANLRSDNCGVNVSAANFIRKYHLTGAVNELKQLLSQEKESSVKMAAALALITVGGTEGRTAVENAIEKEEDEIIVEFYRSVLKTDVTAAK